MAFRVIGDGGQRFAAENAVFADKNLTEMILLRTSPGALRDAMLICKLWNRIIMGSPVLYGSFIMGDVQKLYWTERVKPSDGQHVNMLRNFVIMHLLRGDFCRADNKAAKLKDQLNKSLAFISGAREVESQKLGSQDKDAKKMVLSILSKAKHILGRVKEPTGHPGSNKERQLCMIAKMEAAYDASAARRTCELIQRSTVPNHPMAMVCFHEYRDSALVEMVKNEVATNPSNAEKLVDEITIPENKIVALCQIARYVPQRRSQILQTARILLSQVAFFHGKDKALIEMAKVETLDDPDAAVKTYSQLSDNDDEVDGFIEIAIALYQKNPELGKAWAVQISDEISRARVCIQIAELDRSFFNQALEFTRQVEDEYERFLLILEIGRLDPLIFEVAIEMALIPEQKDDLLENIAEAQATLKDIKGAKNTAKLIEKAHQKAQTFLKIAEIDPVHDLSDVKAAVREIEDPCEKVIAICEIAKSIMRNFAPVDSVYDLAQ